MGLFLSQQFDVDVTGITLSKEQHAVSSRRALEDGVADRLRFKLLDYRQEAGRYDRIVSVGMFEHVGAAHYVEYFTRVKALLANDGVMLLHSIGRMEPPGGTNTWLRKYIFPGGELLHISHVLREMALAGLEMVDTENLRPHYARTLWAWSDALEARLDEARTVLAFTLDAQGADRVLRAYRIYLAGCAMAFEQGWTALHQIVATRPDEDLRPVPMKGAQSGYPFKRDYMYR